ncbi:Mov34/MPN/PAD-1 family protein [Halobacillus sp. KGW1]|uniref:Mov34/MPN/PAD-1 family protein n=1 Tax=Halobacillus sp. KGW1 TaxID=1793726 RepID=UPI0007806067|nr:M67 family metallopeptidase [Halobacillus sp. KGW1]
MIELSEEQYEQIMEHGRREWPLEACGLLAGEEPGVILSVWPLENEWKARNRFFVSAKVVAQTLEHVSHAGHKVLAIYHTHPDTAPYPSYTDLLHHPDDNVIMVILSYKTNPPNMRCFTIKNRTCDEHPFSIKKR